MPVHLFGQCVDMTVYREIADEFGVPLIEDAAQAIGSKDETARWRARGRRGLLQLLPSKNLGGFGDGGVVTTNDDDLAHRIRLLRVHGMEPKYYHPMLGSTRASTRSRRRCCGSSCGTSNRGTTGGAPTRRSTTRRSPRPAPTTAATRSTPGDLALRTPAPAPSAATRPGTSTTST
jgi:hypothetical protein